MCNLLSVPNTCTQPIASPQGFRLDEQAFLKHSADRGLNTDRQRANALGLTRSTVNTVTKQHRTPSAKFIMAVVRVFGWDAAAAIFKPAATA